MSSLPYTQIPDDVFKKLSQNAGVLVDAFTPSTKTLGNIIAATSGGVNVVCTPSYVDFGEDIDNCPKNTKELLHLDTWDCKMSGTFVSVDDTAFKLMVGCATETSSGTGDTAIKKIVPNAEIASSDFTDLWYVTDYGEGGFIAIKLINGLSSGGFSLQTTDKGKGQFAFEFTGYKSIATPDEIPMEFHINKKPASPTPPNSSTP